MVSSTDSSSYQEWLWVIGMTCKLLFTLWHFHQTVCADKPWQLRHHRHVLRHCSRHLLKRRVRLNERLVTPSTLFSVYLHRQTITWMTMHIFTNGEYGSGNAVGCVCLPWSCSNSTNMTSHHRGPKRRLQACYTALSLQRTSYLRMLLLRCASCIFHRQVSYRAFSLRMHALRIYSTFRYHPHP